MCMKIQQITFTGKPNNYAKIDNVLSRSAQPNKEDFAWLKKQGVTDVVNFRTMFVAAIDFDEKEVVESLGMKYHNIPSITAKPQEKNVLEFLNLADNISKNNGKLHLHCQAGADRTGMYSFIYKSMKNIGDMTQNVQEWIQKGHNVAKYPDLIEQTKKIIEKIKI